MERSIWLEEKRRVAEVRYDTLHASSYDQNWGQMNTSHRSFLQRFLALCPPGCRLWYRQVLASNPAERSVRCRYRSIPADVGASQGQICAGANGKEGPARDRFH